MRPGWAGRAALWQGTDQSCLPSPGSLSAEKHVTLYVILSVKECLTFQVCTTPHANSFGMLKAKLFFATNESSKSPSSSSRSDTRRGRVFFHQRSTLEVAQECRKRQPNKGKNNHNASKFRRLKHAWQEYRSGNTRICNNQQTQGGHQRGRTQASSPRSSVLGSFLLRIMVGVGVIPLCSVSLRKSLLGVNSSSSRAWLSSTVCF